MCIQKSIQELCACSHPLFETVKTDRSCDLSVSSGEDYKCVTQLIVEYDIGKDHIYRMVIVEGCCTMARTSSLGANCSLVDTKV